MLYLVSLFQFVTIRILTSYELNLTFSVTLSDDLNFFFFNFFFIFYIVVDFVIH